MKAMHLDHDMLLDAARLMEREGGSFAGHIARAFYCADSTNRERLLTAFDDLFVKFYRQHRLDNFKQFLDDYEEGEM
jgi:hypothetical protein